MFSVIVATVAAILMVVGGIVTLGIICIGAWLIATGRLRPDRTLREATTEINWPFAIGMFVALPTLAGIESGDPYVGFIFGSVYLGFVVCLMWWVAA